MCNWEGWNLWSEIDHISMYQMYNTFICRVVNYLLFHLANYKVKMWRFSSRSIYMCLWHRHRMVLDASTTNVEMIVRAQYFQWPGYSYFRKRRVEGNIRISNWRHFPNYFILLHVLMLSLILNRTFFSSALFMFSLCLALSFAALHERFDMFTILTFLAVYFLTFSWRLALSSALVFSAPDFSTYSWHLRVLDFLAYSQGIHSTKYTINQSNKYFIVSVLWNNKNTKNSCFLSTNTNLNFLLSENNGNTQKMRRSGSTMITSNFQDLISRSYGRS